MVGWQGLFMFHVLCRIVSLRGRVGKYLQQSQPRVTTARRLRIDILGSQDYYDSTFIFNQSLEIKITEALNVAR